MPDKLFRHDSIRRVTAHSAAYMKALNTFSYGNRL